MVLPDVWVVPDMMMVFGCVGVVMVNVLPVVLGAM